MNATLAAVCARYWAGIITPYMVSTDLPETDVETRNEAATILAGEYQKAIEGGKVTKLGIAADGRYSPMLKGFAGDVFAMGGDLLDRRFRSFMEGIGARSTRIVEETDEVLVMSGNGDATLIYPELVELGSGATFEELVSAINTSNERPWLIMRSAAFWDDLIVGDKADEKFEAFHRVEPFEFWGRRGVSSEAIGRMRPGGALWKDADESALGSGARWILLGRKS